jgi:hypothetical protein
MFLFSSVFLKLLVTCRRFTKLRIFNTFDYKYRQNLDSKITNSDKSQTPQFRETAVGGCVFSFRYFKYFIKFSFQVSILPFYVKF